MRRPGSTRRTASNKPRRDHISLKTRLAAALCQMLRPDAAGNLVPVIDHTSATKMTEAQILSVFHFDHYPIPKHRGGPDVHWNLTPRPIPEHRIKTATVDLPAKAKDDRIQESQAEFRRRMLSKAGVGETDGEPPSQRPRASRPIDGAKRSKWKKHMDGRVTRR